LRWLAVHQVESIFHDAPDGEIVTKKQPVLPRKYEGKEVKNLLLEVEEIPHARSVLRMSCGWVHYKLTTTKPAYITLEDLNIIRMTRIAI
jgi:hypothetical protein